MIQWPLEGVGGMKVGKKVGAAATVVFAVLGCVGLGYAAPQGAPEPQTGFGATVSRLFGSPREQFQPRVDYASLDARIRQVMTKPDMVGLGVAIIEDGRIAFVKGYGTTTANGTEPVGVHT